MCIQCACVNVRKCERVCARTGKYRNDVIFAYRHWSVSRAPCVSEYTKSENDELRAASTPAPLSRLISIGFSAVCVMNFFAC